MPAKKTTAKRAAPKKTTRKRRGPAEPRGPEAAESALKEGRVRFVGITGHHDPAILIEAMGRFDFDTVLVAMNPSDPRRLPFLSTVVRKAGHLSCWR